MMRLIGLVITLFLVTYMVMTQLTSNSSTAVRNETLGIDRESGKDLPPRVPTSAEDVDAFKDDFNSYLNKQTEKRSKEIEESLGN